MEKRKVLGFTLSKMQVNVCQVTITTSLSKRTLTKALAKQFPIKWGADRSEASFHGDPRTETVCKVQASVLESGVAGWLVLAEDEVAGLAWFRPAGGNVQANRPLLGRGAWVDDLRQIPTAIL